LWEEKTAYLSAVAISFLKSGRTQTRMELLAAIAATHYLAVVHHENVTCSGWYVPGSARGGRG
jgi:hypothetical protein